MQTEILTLQNIPPANLERIKAERKKRLLRFEPTLLAEGLSPKEAREIIKELWENPELCQAFCRLSKIAATKGKKTGAMMILNVIRWEIEIVKNGDFKVNNNLAPYLGRYFEFCYPQFSGFFEKRRVGS